MPWVLPGLGVVFLVLGVGLVLSVDEVKLGPFASRSVALVLGLMGYYGVAGASAISYQSTRELIVTIVIPILGLAGLAVLLWKAYQNREDELQKIRESGTRIVLIGILATLARVCLSQ